MELRGPALNEGAVGSSIRVVASDDMLVFLHFEAQRVFERLDIVVKLDAFEVLGHFHARDLFPRLALPELQAWHRSLIASCCVLARCESDQRCRRKPRQIDAVVT
eukprot:7263524-Prymnesium_polylepis.2